MSKSKRKIGKKSKRRLAFFGTISLVIIGYFIFSLGYNIYKIYSLQQKENTLSTRLTELQKEEKMLLNETERLEDPDYLAKYAREAYSYSKDDEIIIQKYNEEKKEKKKEEKFTINDKYIITGLSAVIFLIIVYILIKSRKHKKAKKTVYKHQAGKNTKNKKKKKRK